MTQNIGRRERASSSPPTWLANSRLSGAPSPTAASCTSSGTRTASSGERKQHGDRRGEVVALPRVSREHPGQLGPRVRERPPARALGSAASHQLPQRALGVAGRELIDRRSGKRRAVERRRPHGARVRAQVGLRKRGPVGTAVDVDAAVAEAAAHALEIGGRSRSGELLGCRTQMREAATEIGGHGISIRRPHVLLRAGDALRAAGPPLIDEHEVAVLADLREDLVHGDGGSGRRSSRPALEVEERTASGLPRGRDDRDVQAIDARAAGLYAPAVAAAAETTDAARRPPPAAPAGNERHGAHNERDHTRQGEREPQPPMPARIALALAVLLEPGIRLGHCPGSMEHRAYKGVRPLFMHALDRCRSRS